MSDLNELSEEQLMELLRHPERIEALDEPAEAEPEPEPSPEPEREAAPEPEPETAAEPAEPVAEPEQDLEKEELLARIAEMEARQKANDATIGRLGGELGYLKQAGSRRRPEPVDEPAYEPEAESYGEREPRAPRSNSLARYVVEQAAQAGAAQFAAEHPESAELEAEMADYVRNSGYDPSRIYEQDDPKVAHTETRRALEEAFWHAKTVKATKTREELATRRTDQFNAQKAAKQRASVAGSGGTQAPKPPPKTLNDMTEAELKVELKRQLAQR